MEQYLSEKRDELIWALTDQGYNGGQLSRLFKTDRTDIKRCIERKPKDHKTKWEKVCP